MEVTPMGTPAQNVAILKDAYRQWHDTRGASVKGWLDLMTDDVKVRSLADGKPAASFTAESNSKEQFKRYFDGLLAEWDMIHYKTDQFIAEGDRVAMLGSTAWRNRRTGREVHTPKADFWTFRDGKIVAFYELYDTAALIAAAQP
jgi:ketosteroid isomerase-like protein